MSLIDTQKINSGLTPMMVQYLKIKQGYQDAILFFRLGDFYEMFFDDAKYASSILGLTLTSREAGKDNRVPMCGIPYHAADNYISRLIRHGEKIAICEQIEDPKLAKGLVKRDIVRVITPGTLIGQNVLNQPQNNYLVCVYQRSQEDYGLAAADLSTGEFKVTQLNSKDKLLSELTRLQPAELLLSAAIKADEGVLTRIKQSIKTTITDVEEWAFDYLTAQDKLRNHFKVNNLRGFGCEDMPQAISAAAAALRYLEDTQKTELLHINKITPYLLNKFMVLDSAARRNLELIRTTRGDKKATLLGILNFTQVAMGNRLIIQWIQQPLLDIPQINKRLDAVEELQKDQFLRNQLRDTLKNIIDIERLLSRISLGVANARDIFGLNQSLKIIPALKKILKNTKSQKLVEIKHGMLDLNELVEYIDKAIREDAPLSVREGRMIKKGFSDELDELLKVTQGGRDWIAALQQQEIKRTGITSLKVKYNRVFGYYIEVTNANLHLVPADYTRKQTLANAERFITPALKEQEEKILTAQERMVELEYQLFLNVCQRVLDDLICLQDNAMFIAVLDVLNSLAEAAARNDYTRPELLNSSVIKITDGRHPVLENLLSRGKFIPNNTCLDDKENQIAIITGPNMAGKSTYIRQVALIVLMGQMGSFVPAKSAQIGIVDRIFTRVGAADDITAGMSTFMIEMSETANILNNATSKSLIILDEIGRGTSTFDGLSIAWASAEYLHNNASMRPRTLFATHYHELAELELMHKGVKNYNVSVREWEDEVIFLYKLVRGTADHSYGIHVGRLAGLPKPVIMRAREILSNLEINSISADGIPSLVKTDRTKKKKQDMQLELFQNKKNKIMNELQSLDINKINPLEAFNLINKWKEKLDNRE